MKKILVIAASAALVLASCNKVNSVPQAEGFLNFSDLQIDNEEIIMTKAVSAASGNYSIFIYDSEDKLVKSATYAEVKANDNKLSLSAGDYTLVARSTEEDVPAAAFAQPVYGATTAFNIQAGEVTSIGALTCTLLQTKVTVAYSDEFLAMVTGDGKTTVEVTTGSPLEYELSYNGGNPSYEQEAGYFAVNNGANTTMTVTFSGKIEGKTAKMVKAFEGISPKQWRQVRFVKKVNAEGQATFDIVINDYVDDVELNNLIAGNEAVIGEDPDAPKGDGGIELLLDYEAGCDAEFTSLDNIVFPIIASTDAPTVCLKLKALVPNGVKKFSVDIVSDNEAFSLAVNAADATHLDLISPSDDNMIIFQVVPFPYGADLYGQTELSFDLSTAQPAMMIGPYYGTHKFTMNITDLQGCKKSILVQMIVNK